MSGSSSGAVTEQYAPFDPGGVQQFANSSTGQRYTPEQLGYLTHRYQASNGASYNAPLFDQNKTDITQLVTDYNTWVSRQQALLNTHDQYASLVKDQPGRDATTLTGPEVNPNLVPYFSGPSLLMPNLKPGGAV